MAVKVSKAMRQKVEAANLPAEQHEAAFALKAPAESRQLDWGKVVSLIGEYGPVAAEIFRKLLESRKPATKPPA